MVQFAQSANKEFANLLNESIREGLKNAIGESGMQAVFFHLGLSEHIGDPEAFHKAMYSLFREGTIVLEKIIVKELFRKLNTSDYLLGDFGFEKYVNSAKEIFEKRMNGGEQM
ncbi:MAG: hypothetical protein HYU02_08075 [Thaumarchaeota archaeon]|nr:hypothetical protein [Nitrososphaerota archaeon]